MTTFEKLIVDQSLACENKGRLICAKYLLVLAQR